MCVTVQSVRDIAHPSTLFDVFSDPYITAEIGVICRNRAELVASTINTRFDVIRYEVAHGLWMQTQTPNGGQMLGELTGYSAARGGSTTTKSHATVFGNGLGIGESYERSHYGRMWHKLWIALPPILSPN